MRKIVMRKLFFALLVALTFAACSSDPVFHGMTTKQKEDYAKAIAGEYKGTYVIIYNDGGSDTKAVKKEGVQMTVTDLTMHSVCFHDYPVSLLSNVVEDRALAEALAGAPNVDFLVDYRFYSLWMRVSRLPVTASSSLRLMAYTKATRCFRVSTASGRITGRSI